MTRRRRAAVQRSDRKTAWRVGRGSRLRIFVTTLFACAVCWSSTLASIRSTEPVRGQLDEDRALVYFFRAKGGQGSARTIFMYAGREFLGTIDAGCYTFSHLDPGTHQITLNWQGWLLESDFEAGETYYYRVPSFTGGDGGSESHWFEGLTYCTPSPKEEQKAKEIVDSMLHGEQGKKGKYSRKINVQSFFEAALSGDRVRIDGFLRNGTDLEVRDKDGATALIRVSLEGSRGAVETLLELGADVNARVKGKEGRTALMVAASMGHAEVVELLLLSPDIDVNAATYPDRDDGVTALDFATTNNHQDSRDLLLAHPEVRSDMLDTE